MQTLLYFSLVNYCTNYVMSRSRSCIAYSILYDDAHESVQKNRREENNIHPLFSGELIINNYPAKSRGISSDT